MFTMGPLFKELLYSMKSWTNVSNKDIRNNNVNLLYLVSPSLSVLTTKSGCLLCYNIGPVSLSVKTNQGGYYPGDSILICMEARNNSSRRITAVQAVLKQIVLFHGHFVQSHHAHLIGQQSIGAVGIYKIVVHTYKTKIIQMIEDIDIRTCREIYNWVDMWLHVHTSNRPYCNFNYCYLQERNH